MLVSIKFTKNGCCSAIGNFAPDDVARVTADMARHLVGEAMVAKYDGHDPVTVATAEPLAEPEAKRKPGRPRKG